MRSISGKISNRTRDVLGINMRIALVAPVFERIPPLLYGGTGRVIKVLLEGLVARGHDVTLFATGNSQPPPSARLKYMFDEPISVWDSVADDLQANFAFQHAREFDVIHDHTYTNGAVKYSQIVDTLALTTLHNGPYKDRIDPVYKYFPEYPLVSISMAQQRAYTGVDFVANIYNSVNTEEFTIADSKDKYMLHIGAISLRKGSHIAVEVAKRLGYPLKLAGKLDHPFFEENIAPHLEPGLIEYVGEVGGDERVKLFQKARLLLFPITWLEPFGLVMIEAMACGCPVIAFNKGSVPEVVQDRETGFIVSTIEEMCDAVKKVDSIEPQRCRDHVVHYFRDDILLDKYENLYKKLLKQRSC